MIKQNRVIIENLRTMLELVPLIVIHNHITTFDELVDIKRTTFPKCFYSSSDVREIAIKLYHHEENQDSKMSRWINDLNRHFNRHQITEETVREILEEKGYTNIEF